MRTTLSISLGLTALLGAAIAFNPASAAGPSFSKQIDPVERSFSVEMPDGWNNALGLTRSQGSFQLPRSWASSSSPDGATNWFIGDPNVPLFHVPVSDQMLQSVGMGMMSPQQGREFMKNYFRKEGIAIRAYQSAQQFSEAYARRRFGKQPGFRVLGHAPNPRLAKAIADLDRRLGTPARQIDTVTTRFEYSGFSGEVWASSGQLPGDPNMWAADVSGFTTPAGNGNSHDSAAKLFSRSALSLDISPKWLAREKQRGEQRQAQIAQQNQNRLQQSQQQHQQRMAMMQNNFNAHQQRMAGRSAAMDQQNQAWQAGQDRSYQQHQSFVRGIQDRTVVNSPNSYGGPSFEVDAGANNYYVDPLNNQYFGTDAPLDQGQIPDGYQQATEQSSDW